MRNRMIWTAVRCCCQPTKILGFMLLTEEQLRQRILLVRLRTEVKSIALAPLYRNNGPTTQILETHELRLETMNTQHSVETAIYSEERPMTFWRKVPGFVEVTQ